MSEFNRADFELMMDELILVAIKDPELQDAISWLDKTDVYGAGLNFYEKCYEVLVQHNIKISAKEWLANKNGKS